MIVQYFHRAVGDRWQRHVRGVPERFTPYKQPRCQTSHFMSVLAQMREWLSLRFRDAPLGAITLLLIVVGVILLPLATSLGGVEPSIRRAFSILMFVFPPAILSAVYSLFFEKSKLSATLNVLLATIVLLVQPLVWHWLNLYLPVGCAFAIFCAVVWTLRRRVNS